LDPEGRALDVTTHAAALYRSLISWRPVASLWQSALPGPTPRSSDVAPRWTGSAQLREHRLVTLTGVGGVGKTRLAARAAAETPADIADDVFWVSLAPVDDPRLVASTVCSSLDVRPAADTSPLDALARRLRSSRPWP
jgi:hypothetical protein